MSINFIAIQKKNYLWKRMSDKCCCSSHWTKRIWLCELAKLLTLGNWQPKKIAQAAFHSCSYSYMWCALSKVGIIRLYFMTVNSESFSEFLQWIWLCFKNFVFLNLVECEWNRKPENMVSIGQRHCSYPESFNESRPQNFPRRQISRNCNVPPNLPSCQFLLMGVSEVKSARWQTTCYSTFKRSYTK